MAYTSDNALKIGYKIYASDINELKAEIKGELDRRHRHDFTNFNNDLLASKNSNITPDIWNNLINPLNTINEDITKYSNVNQYDYIKALIKLSLVRGIFNSYDESGTGDQSLSGCKAGCLGLCWGCEGCTGTCTSDCGTGCGTGCTDGCEDHCW